MAALPSNIPRLAPVQVTLKVVFAPAVGAPDAIPRTDKCQQLFATVVRTFVTGLTAALEVAVASG